VHIGGRPVDGTVTVGADLGGQLPDIVVDPVNPAVNVFIQLGEAGDEIILTQEDLPDNILSVGARVLEHNLEPTQDQDCGFGIILPAECVGPVPSFNAFPTTFDTQGIGSVGNEPTMNWLFARPGCGDCALAGGWYRFSDMGIFQPSGDWNIRLTYQPTECPEDIGACCVDGVCIGDDILNTDCVAQGGEFQGDGVLCADVDCPVPTGACCYDPGDGTQICEDGFTQAQCANEMNSLYLGDDSTCGPGACDPPTGACCFEQGLGNQVCDVLTQAECAALPLSTYFGDDTVCGPDICIGACCNPEQGTCVSTTRSLCELAGLIWRGEGLDCETFSCFGVCCMPDGSCENNGGIGLLEEDCAAMGGVWDDSTTDCAEADCPDPLGACCLQSGACLQLDEATCLSLNGDWGGAASTCVEFCVDPTGACCFSNGNCAESLTESNCLDLGGTWSEGQVCATVCSCPGDSDGDNIVGLSDLLDVLSNWGSGGSSGGDVNNDLSVDLSDLLEVLSNWGSMC